MRSSDAAPASVCAPQNRHTRVGDGLFHVSGLERNNADGGAARAGCDRWPASLPRRVFKLGAGQRTTHAHAGSRTRVTSMGGLYDAATLRAPMKVQMPGCTAVNCIRAVAAQSAQTLGNRCVSNAACFANRRSQRFPCAVGIRSADNQTGACCGNRCVSNVACFANRRSQPLCLCCGNSVGWQATRRMSRATCVLMSAHDTNRALSAHGGGGATG